MIRIALVGQPNSGKSTIFNHLVGYRAHTSNFPGTTVEYLESQAYIDGLRAEVIDLPGVYSLTSSDEAETQTRDYLLHRPVDVIFNVVDASLLSRSLELSLQLLEFGIPLVLCLNMGDEARRKGIEIDPEALSETLGVPVVPAIAVRGIGVKAAARACARTARAGQAAPPPRYSPDVETAIGHLESEVRRRDSEASHHGPRLIALKLIESDPHFLSLARDLGGGLVELAEEVCSDFASRRGKPPDRVVSSERHARAMEIFESVSTVGSPTVGLRDRIDGILMHPTFGLFALGAILYGLFLFVFKVGSLVEGPLIGLFDRSIELLAGVLPEGGLAFAAVSGLIQGFGGALGIVLPYLVPFLLGLALLEDIGYLPRAGYLVDGLMHRIGLHGKSIIPFILGYGCSVPAVMATRILESRRDRFITAMLATMVPCVARATIIFGLIGYFLGPHLAFLLYVINVVVIAAVGKILTRLAPSVTPGLILEIPSYKIPSHHVIAAKVWLRIHDFLRHAVPILVLGSVVLALLEALQATHALNLAVSPITWALGLPLSLGVTLIFGIFRKELSLVMLFQALGTTQVLTVLSAGQMMTFTLFVMFYVPCVATIAVLKRELGWRLTALAVAGTTSTALAIALVARGIASALPYP
jgi:ferrous iron transport protein B